jgi:hypothetical protein
MRRIFTGVYFYVEKVLFFIKIKVIVIDFSVVVVVVELT